MMSHRPDFNPHYVREASRAELDRLRGRRTDLAKELRKVAVDIAWRESMLALVEDDETNGKEAAKADSG